MKLCKLQELSELVGQLYDIVTDGNKWADFLESFCDTFQCDGIHLVVFDPSQDQYSLSLNHGGDEIDLDEYHATYSTELASDPRYVLAAQHPNKPLHCGMIPSQSAFRNSPIQSEFFDQYDVYYHLFCMVPDEDKDGMIGIAAWRGRNADPFTQSELDKLGQLLPHLKRAIALQHEFLNVRLNNNPAAHVLETIPIGIIICDSGGRAYLVNAMARQILEKSDGLIHRHGLLWASTAEQNTELRDAIRQAVEEYGTAKTSSSMSMVLRRNKHNSDLLMSISAVAGNCDAINTDLFNQPVAVIYLSDPDLQWETPYELLQRMFGLTIAEARLLRTLLEKASLKKAAETNGLTEGTARGYLKQIFSKTQTNSQVELLRLVSRSPAWIQHQAADPLHTAAIGPN